MEPDRLAATTILVKNIDNGESIELCSSCCNNVQKLGNTISNLQIEIINNDNQKEENAEVTTNRPPIISSNEEETFFGGISHQSLSQEEETQTTNGPNNEQENDEENVLPTETNENIEESSNQKNTDIVFETPTTQQKTNRMVYETTTEEDEFEKAVGEDEQKNLYQQKSTEDLAVSLTVNDAENGKQFEKAISEKVQKILDPEKTATGLVTTLIINENEEQPNIDRNNEQDDEERMGQQTMNDSDDDTETAIEMEDEKIQKTIEEQKQKKLHQEDLDAAFAVKLVTDEAENAKNEQQSIALALALQIGMEEEREESNEIPYKQQSLADGEKIDEQITMRDNKAKKQYGIKDIEVVVRELHFEKAIKDDIQRKKKGKKRKASRSDSSDEDIRSALRMLKNRKKLLKQANEEGMEVDDNGEDDTMQDPLQPSTSTSSQRLPKTRSNAKNNKKFQPVSARKMNNDDDEREWLSKECSADKSKLNRMEVKIEEESLSSGDESDSNCFFKPNKPKLTREKYKEDKEIRKLLKEADATYHQNGEEENLERKDDDDDDDDDSFDENVKKGKKSSKRRIIDTDEDDVETIDDDGLNTDGFEVITLGKKSSTSKAARIENKEEKEKQEKNMTAKKQHKGKTARPKEKEVLPRKRRRHNIVYSDEEEMMQPLKEEMDGSDEEEERPKKQKGSGKKKIKAQETKEAEKVEKERRKRLEERQKEFNGIELVTTEEDGRILYSGGVPIPQLRNIVLDRDAESDEPMPVKVHPSLVKVLKKHQAEGIRFIYDCTIESLYKLDEGGGGCILGHCMGLGKTLQIISFLHTIMTHPKIGKQINKVLIVVPMNVIINWVEEFEKWLFNNDPELDTINYSNLIRAKNNQERLDIIRYWASAEDQPSVLIIGYEMYRNLTLIEEDTEHLKKNKNKPVKKKKNQTKNSKELEKLKPKFRKYLYETPHMVICDEGHKLKSTETSLFCTIRHIVTKRKVCMTGTPIQNNLKEYYCMVNFVKPNLLGTWKEYKNRFATPIKQGRAKDASQYEIRIMRFRCHILFERLRGILDRRDYSILVDSLPPKQDYVIFVRLTERQIELYEQCRQFLKTLPNYTKKLLLAHFILYRVWTHPYLLVEHERNEERKRLMEDCNDFIDNEDNEIEDDGFDDDDDELDQEADEEMEDGPSTSTAAKRPSKQKKKEDQAGDRRKSNGKSSKSPDMEGGETPPAEIQEWARNLVSEANLVSEDDQNAFQLSNKLMLLVEIIKKCEEIGDKLLVFSQFLNSISLIERMLNNMIQTDQWFANGHSALMMANGEQWVWQKGVDYDVIDGAVSSPIRSKIQVQFNDFTNFRNRLLLISTRAGSLGTNLVGANRVVIFDCTWNPSHDTQGLFRVYRFGQTKPICIYRLVAQGTMEERIYNRQVTKESVAKRVTQSAQIGRHYTMNELEAEEMFEFHPAPLPDPNSSDKPHLDPPKDRLLGDIILKGGDEIVNYHTHDLLFNDVEDEKLTEEERDQAWADYERERHPLPPPPLPMTTADGNQQQIPPVGGFGTAADILQQQQAFIQKFQQQLNQRDHPHILYRLQQALQVHMASQMQQTKAASQQQQPKLNQIPPRQPSTSKSTTFEPLFKQKEREFKQTMQALYQTYGVDKFYLMCKNEISGMPTEIAMKLYKMKQFLCYFVLQIPIEMLGHINALKFNTILETILQNAKSNNYDHNWVYEKMLTTLRTTIELAKGVPTCAVGINYVSSEFPDVQNVELLEEQSD